MARLDRPVKSARRPKEPASWPPLPSSSTPSAPPAASATGSCPDGIPRISYFLRLSAEEDFSANCALDAEEGKQYLRAARADILHVAVVTLWIIEVERLTDHVPSRIGRHGGRCLPRRE